MSTRAGIDLGTTYSAVAYYDETTGKPIILNNSYDKELTPSVISFLDDGRTSSWTMAAMPPC